MKPLDNDEPSPEPAAQSPSTGPLTWCILAALLCGTWTPASKPLFEYFSPLLLSGLLYLGAALAVAPWAIRNLGPSRCSILHLAGAVLFGGIIAPVLLLTGLSMASAASVALWLNLETVATALLARYFFQEHLSTRTWLAVAIIVIASVTLSGVSLGAVVSGLLVAGACVAWGLDNNFTAVIDEFTPAQVTFAKGGIAGIFNTVAGLMMARRSFDLPALSAALGIGALAVSTRSTPRMKDFSIVRQCCYASNPCRAEA